MGAVVPVPIAMYTDNEATRIAVRNPGATQRTRFFEMWMTALRKLQLERVIDVQWVATTEMIADIFTKPLDHSTRPHSSSTVHGWCLIHGRHEP